MKFPVVLRCSAHDTSDALDLRRRATTPLVDLGNVHVPTPPVWTPDGKAILYACYGPVEGEIVRDVLDGSVPDLVLLRLPGTVFCPLSISPDGRRFLIVRDPTERVFLTRSRSS